jgi:hypothetical protein
MNVGRVVAAAVAVTVWDAIYGFCVYGVVPARRGMIEDHVHGRQAKSRA